MSSEPSQSPPNKSSNTSRLHTTLALMHRCLVADKRGATAIEYALIAAGIGAAVAATVFGFGSELKTTFYDKIAALL